MGKRAGAVGIVVFGMTLVAATTLSASKGEVQAKPAPAQEPSPAQTQAKPAPAAKTAAARAECAPGAKPPVRIVGIDPADAICSLSEPETARGAVNTLEDIFAGTAPAQGGQAPAGATPDVNWQEAAPPPEPAPPPAGENRDDGASDD